MLGVALLATKFIGVPLVTKVGKQLGHESGQQLLSTGQVLPAVLAMPGVDEGFNEDWDLTPARAACAFCTPGDCTEPRLSIWTPLPPPSPLRTTGHGGCGGARGRIVAHGVE